MWGTERDWANRTVASRSSVKNTATAPTCRSARPRSLAVKSIATASADPSSRAKSSAFSRFRPPIRNRICGCSSRSSRAVQRPTFPVPPTRRMGVVTYPQPPHGSSVCYGENEVTSSKFQCWRGRGTRRLLRTVRRRAIVWTPVSALIAHSRVMTSSTRLGEPE